MIGSIIDGRYLIIDTIGAGGMGAVYAAEHMGTGRRVAVKLINVTEIQLSPQVIGRFQREAKAAGAIETQHIVQVFDFGTDPATHAPYLVMEYLTGEDLRTLLNRRSLLFPDLALRIVAQTCIGLQKANEAQVIHRDIKPANIFLARRDLGERVVKLLDFGIAKITNDLMNDGEMPDLTRTGRLVGSPLYMSPEQVRGSKLLDHRTDIWSLGIVLYELLTGSTPFQNYSGFGEVLVAICHENPRPLQELAPWVPANVVAIVDRALRRAPHERFPSAAAMFDAIRALLPNGWTITDDMLVPMAQRNADSSSAVVVSISASASSESIPTGTTQTLDIEQVRARGLLQLPTRSELSGITAPDPLPQRTTRPEVPAKPMIDPQTSGPRGAISRIGTNETLILRSEMLFGRSAACDVRINEPRVSSEHARLRWTGTAWEIRDLGSKNGTFVANRRLSAGDRVTLIARDSFGLGGAAAPAPVFVLTDASAPVMSARSARTGIVRIAADGLLTLPDDEHPDVCVVESRDGQWTIEADGTARIASENDTINVGGDEWILDVPHVAASTMAVESVVVTLESIALHFLVSADERHIVVTVKCPDKDVHLSAQNHHRLLLELARERLRSAHLPDSERGWLDRSRVLELLRVNEQRLNVEICSARREFAALEIQGSANIIEKRPGTTSMRLGVEHIEVKNVSS